MMSVANICAGTETFDCLTTGQFEFEIIRELRNFYPVDSWFDQKGQNYCTRVGILQRKSTWIA